MVVIGWAHEIQRMGDIVKCTVSDTKGAFLGETYLPMRYFAKYYHGTITGFFETGGDELREVQTSQEMYDRHGLYNTWALSYSDPSRLAFCTDGVAYDLSNNLFCNANPTTRDLILSDLQQAERMFLLFLVGAKDGKVYDITLATNIPKDSKIYSKSICRGFLPESVQGVRKLGGITENAGGRKRSPKDKLTQEEIDDLLHRYMRQEEA